MLDTPQQDQVADRIKLPFTFDVQKLEAEYEQLKLGGFVYYNVLQLRGPAHLIDPSIPPPTHQGEFADGSWTDWLDSKDLHRSPYLEEVADFFKAHTKVTLVRLLRLSPNAVVKEHTDPTLALEVERSVVRLTIPIFSPEAVLFYLNHTVVPMKEGECWYMRLTDPHKIENFSDKERVNMTIDMIPNDWVREQILSAQV